MIFEDFYSILMDHSLLLAVLFHFQANYVFHFFDYYFDRYFYKYLIESSQKTTKTILIKKSFQFINNYYFIRLNKNLRINQTINL